MAMEAIMFTLTLDDKTAARLQEIAREQNRSPNDVVRDWVEQVAVTPTGNPNWLKQMAENVEKDREIVWKDEPDLSERSREILNNEFADYLMKRMQQNDNDEHTD